MSALCHVTPYLYYSAFLYWSVSFSLLSSCAFFFLCLTVFEICLLKHLYHKDCITTRQSWLFSFYVVVNKNNKQDKKKLENITIIFYSIMYYCPFLRYTTIGRWPSNRNDLKEDIGLWMFLILLILILEGYFLKNRTIFDFVDKLSPVSNMAYSCLKKC